MKLFIIGNGFDRAHGLETSYWDFRTYLEEKDIRFLHSFEENYYIYPARDIETKQNLLWNELETNLANIDEDQIIDMALDMDMGLDSGDIGIYDTLYEHFTEEYKYIKKMAVYLKQWVKTIDITNVLKRTTNINNTEDDIYINFNYTLLLETIYKVNSNQVIHIHGSISKFDENPILGHGNEMRINNIKEKYHKAENLFSEKEMSIYRVIRDYYTTTYKEINRYLPKLHILSIRKVEAIYVIGHSISGVDIPYFRVIDEYTGQKLYWNLFYYSEFEKQRIMDNLNKCGIESERIIIKHSREFFNL